MKKMIEFTPKKRFLICVDSDGCAIDSMRIKHDSCFGRALIDVWELENYKENCHKIWNEINLYSKTRGINRFLGLLRALKRINDEIISIENLDDLANYIKGNDVYSNLSLSEYIKNNPSDLLEKCLKWSNLTNEYIKNLNNSNVIEFPYVREQLRKMAQKADIAVVSSANYEAINTEWNRLGLSDYVDVCCTQEDGSKAKCIEKLIKGYKLSNVIMVGDSLGDLGASRKNGIYFYPIEVNKEKESWKKIDSYLDLFYNNQMDHCQHRLIQQFENNFMN